MTGMASYHCAAKRSWHRNAAHMEAGCAAQRAALAAPAAADWYGALGCNTIAGHYDMSVFRRMDPAVREKTLVIINSREPVSTRVSLYNYLPQLVQVACKDVVQVRRPVRCLCWRGRKRQACLGGCASWTRWVWTHVCPPAPRTPQSRNFTLAEFARGEWGLGIDLVDGATKMVAGDYCCFDAAPKYDTAAARLRAALDALHTEVGVVVVKERMADSLEVRRSGGRALACGAPGAVLPLPVQRHARPAPPAPARPRRAVPFIRIGMARDQR